MLLPRRFSPDRVWFLNLLETVGFGLFPLIKFCFLLKLKYNGASSLKISVPKIIKVMLMCDNL